MNINETFRANVTYDYLKNTFVEIPERGRINPQPF